MSKKYPENINEFNESLDKLKYNCSLNTIKQNKSTIQLFYKLNILMINKCLNF